MPPFYSPSTGGFYLPAIHAQAIPADALEISPAEHAALLSAQASGKGIAPGPNGRPQAVTPPPEPPPPIVVSAWQLRRALNQLGLRAAVEQAVAGADQDTQDGWEYATSVAQDHPMVTTMAASLNLPQEQVQALFQLAREL